MACPSKPSAVFLICIPSGLFLSPPLADCLGVPFPFFPTFRPLILPYASFFLRPSSSLSTAVGLPSPMCVAERRKKASRRSGGSSVRPAGRGEDDRVGVRMIGEGEKPAGCVRCGGLVVRPAGRVRMIGGICKRGSPGLDAGPLGIQKKYRCSGSNDIF